MSTPSSPSPSVSLAARLRTTLHLGRLGPVLVLLSFAILLVLLLRDVQSLPAQIDWSRYVGVMGVGLLLYLVPLIIQLLVWSDLMTRLGGVQHGWRNVEAFSYSHLLRRIPGAVWYLVGRTTLYRAYGVDVQVPLVASAVEWLLLMLGSAVVVVAFSLVTSTDVVLGLSVLACLTGLGAAVVHRLFTTSVNARLLKGLLARLPRVTSVSLPRRREIWLWLCLYVGAYIAGGVILMLMVQGVASDFDASLLIMIRIWALVGGIGTLLSTIIPAGMGIRELSLTVALAPYMTTSTAIFVSIVLRILFMLADVLWGGLILVSVRLYVRWKLD